MRKYTKEETLIEKELIEALKKYETSEETQVVGFEDIKITKREIRVKLRSQWEIPKTKIVLDTVDFFLGKFPVASFCVKFIGSHGTADPADMGVLITFKLMWWQEEGKQERKK